MRLVLKDGSERDFGSAKTAGDVAAAVAPSLAKHSVACRINGQLADLSATPASGNKIEFLRRDDDDAETLTLIRHDCAHILAQAVLQLFPDTQPTIGPPITNGFFYDFHRATPFTESDLETISKRMHELVREKIPFVREVWTRDAATAHYQKHNEPFKVELVAAIPADETITFYRQGDFLDLCRGPHMRHTGDCGHAFALTHVAGAYWRGDAKNPQLQRIYGTAWRTDEDLKAYLHQREEALRRDHRRLGREMDLFHTQDEAAGMVFWHDRGWTLYRTVESYIRRRQQAGGYVEVKTPQLADRRLWEQSGHWQKFRDNMYLAENEAGLHDYTADPERAPIFALKPMNCPCHVQIYNQGIKSYRDLPLRMAEFGSCHRFEPSGALHGIMRVRSFVQDDAHIFCREEQVADETVQFVELLTQIYRDFGFDKFSVNFADRPAVRAGEDAVWDKAEASLRDACARAGVQWTLNAGEGAFYGPKLEFVLHDAIGREWQCGTWQIDFVLPERLGAQYTADSGERLMPVMCHRAIIGSFERFIGILLEHHAGHLPLWLAPLQVVVATVVSDAADYAVAVGERLAAAGARYALDCRSERINYKVREHSASKTPLLFVVGRKEAEQNTVAVRRLGSDKTQTQSLDDALATLVAESAAPF